MIIASIDPGKKGAICVMPEGSRPVFFDIDSNPVSAVKMAKELAPDYWVMEKVGPRHTDSKQNIWTFGRGVGHLEGAIDSSIFYVTPRSWQSWCGVYGAGKNTKKAAYDVLLLMYGHDFARERFKGKRGGIIDGRCDACLIGHWFIENVVNK